MKKISGFTLLELLVTMGIAGVAVALAVPAVTSIVQKGKMTTFGNDLVSAIHVARSEAIKRSAVACVCPSTNAMAVTPACSGADEWETGWIAFYDSSGDCVFNPADATPDVLLKAADGRGFENFTIRNNNPTINGVDYIRFNSRGTPTLQNGAIQQGMFVICDEREYVLDAYGETIPRGLILSASGSLRGTNEATRITACPL